MPRPDVSARRLSVCGDCDDYRQDSGVDQTRCYHLWDMLRLTKHHKDVVLRKYYVCFIHDLRISHMKCILCNIYVLGFYDVQYQRLAIRFRLAFR